MRVAEVEDVQIDGLVDSGYRAVAATPRKARMEGLDLRPSPHPTIYTWRLRCQVRSGYQIASCICICAVFLCSSRSGPLRSRSWLDEGALGKGLPSEGEVRCRDGVAQRRRDPCAGAPGSTA